jgi:hypothetical protein
VNTFLFALAGDVPLGALGVALYRLQASIT